MASTSRNTLPRPPSELRPLSILLISGETKSDAPRTKRAQTLETELETGLYGSRLTGRLSQRNQMAGGPGFYTTLFQPDT